MFDSHPPSGESTLSLGDAVAIYEQLSPHKNRLDEEGQDALKAAIARITPAQQFVVVTQDSAFEGIHGRLFDAVHAPKRAEQLVARLGDPGTNKLAMAMAVQDESGKWFPTAVVYTYWNDQLQLPDRIKPILKSPVHPLGDTPKVIVPYTISSNFPKAGETLIGNVHSYVYSQAPGAVLSTLSPLRAGTKGFASWLAEQGVTTVRIDGQELKDHAFDYLMPVQGANGGIFRSNDPVQSFHMAGMGALLAAIRAENQDSKLDLELAHGVMANYVYPEDPEILRQNKARFVNDGILTVSPELAEQVPERYHDRMYVQPYQPAGRVVDFTPGSFSL